MQDIVYYTNLLKPSSDTYSYEEMDKMVRGLKELAIKNNIVVSIPVTKSFHHNYIEADIDKAYAEEKICDLMIRMDTSNDNPKT